MIKATFKGGIHPPERKKQTEKQSIEYVKEIKQVVIPVNQHFGTPIQPIVNVGDAVKRGQKIADGDGKMAVPVHASISGIVKKIEPRLLANNSESVCIIIESDNTDVTKFMPPLDGFTCKKEDALARIREAGIIGMGGAGFPAHVKYSPPKEKSIRLVIVNAAECEPYLTIDEQLLKEYTNDIVEGLAIVMNMLGVTRGVIGLEDNKTYLVNEIEKSIIEHSHGFDISVRIVKTKYPQGGEKMLITALTGKEVPSGGLPMDVGCVVSNPGTLKAVSDAFGKGMPCIERGLTFSGNACLTPKNLIVPVGALVSDLVPDNIRIDDNNLKRIVSGGPMMGVSLPNYSIPVQKNTSGFLFMDKNETEANAEGICIRCGRCMRACPCRISPALMNEALLASDLEYAEEIGLFDCIECGACSYVCPARVWLVQRFRVGKQLSRIKKQKESRNVHK